MEVGQRILPAGGSGQFNPYLRDLRDRIALEILFRIYSKDRYCGDIAKEAYAMADAMLEAREKR